MANGSDGPKEFALENPLLGKLSTKGFRLTDLLWPALVLTLGYISLTLYTHAADSKLEKGELIQTLKESNKEVADALKASNSQTAEIIRQMALEQKRATDVLRELACLNDPALKGRQDARELCKRVTR